MVTVTKDEYAALNEVHRNGYLEKEAIWKFDRLRNCGWIEPFKAPNPFAEPCDEWQLSSAGRLEHILYEKANGVTDGRLRNIKEE